LTRILLHALPPPHLSSAKPPQGVILAILVYTGVIYKDTWTYSDRRNMAASIQDFLICIEMFVAALAHAYAFPPRVRERERGGGGGGDKGAGGQGGGGGAGLGGGNGKRGAFRPPPLAIYTFSESLPRLGV
jgi:hypothetical protein